MKPLICFYRFNNYIYSENYELHSCAEQELVSSFLENIETAYAKELKILQLNFEALSESENVNLKPLYPAAKASVFILKEYKIMTESELLASHAAVNLKLKFSLLENENKFKEKVEKIRSEICTGRIYQVNLTSALRAETTHSNLDLFFNYLGQFKGPYRALLPLQNVDVFSYSPELFLERTGLNLKTQPIKGSLAQDLNFTEGLAKNTKEEAELSMIVDLLRNDLNRIEPRHSAQVTKHRTAMELGYIQHTYSEICTQTDALLTKILNCSFPGGSISGCPKLESLKVIAELEVFKRQVYTGAIGWWQNNDFCLNIAIRSFIKHKNELFYHAGCGIVFDSDPEKEWQEFIMKTGNLINA